MLLNILQYRQRASLLLGLYIVILSMGTAHKVAGQIEFRFKIDSLSIDRELGLAQDYVLGGHLDSAIHIYIGVLDKSRYTFYSYGTVKSMIGLGNIYADMGRFGDAIHIYQEAVRFCNSLSTKKLLTTLYNNIGNVYFFRGDLSESMRNYETAIMCAERYISDLPLETLYGNIAVPLNNLDQPKKALFYLQKAETLALSNDNYYSLGNIYINMGTSYSILKDFIRSKGCYDKALLLAKGNNYVNIQQSAYANMGIIALNNNQVAEAISHLKMATEVKGVNNPFYFNLSLIAMGAAYLKLGEYDSAEQYLNRSLVVAREAGMLADLARIHNMLSELYAETHRHDLAFGHLKQEKLFTDSIRKQEIVNAVAQIETKYRTALKDREITAKQLTINQQNIKLNNRKMWVLVISACTLVLMTYLVFQRKNHKHKQNLKNEQVKSLIRKRELDIMKAMMNGEEIERRRLARDLHDSIMIQFSVVKMHLSSLAGKEAVIINKESLKPVILQLDEATDNLRRTAHNLMPDMLLEDGLVDAVDYFSNNLQKIFPFDISFQSVGEIPRFNVRFELSVYRIIQELVQNIIKHAAATKAIIQLSYENKLLCITVEDNGKGMVVKAGGDSKGLGIKSIYARVKSMNGRIEIQSQLNIGTTVNLEFDEPSLNLFNNNDNTGFEINEFI